MPHYDRIYFGRDMHGVDVLQGDTVMLFGPMISEARKGLTGTVTGEGPEQYKRKVLENGMNPMGALVIDEKTLAHVSHVVKVSDAASWGEIERYTGWSPGWESGPGHSFSAFGSYDLRS